MSYAAAAGAALSIYGSMKQGIDQKSTLDYKAQIEEQNAHATMISAKLNADKQMLQFSKLQGADIANYGASGVSADSGSVLSVLASNAASAELDKQNILYGGQIRSVNYENQASMDRVAGDRANTAGYISAIGNLFKGGSQIAGQTAGGGDGT